jgi:hypothetical protein
VATHPAERLPFGTRAAIESARALRFQYAVQVYHAPNRARTTIVVLGEAHLKSRNAARVGRELVAQFALRGVESVQIRGGMLGRALWLTVMLPRTLLRWASLGAICDSTIVDAKQRTEGLTIELEKCPKQPLAVRIGATYLTVLFAILWSNLLVQLLGYLHIPIPETVTQALATLAQCMQLHMALLIPAWLLRERPWAFWLHPLLGILSVRDRLMADGIAAMTLAHPDAETALVIMGRAHVPGVDKLLLANRFVRVAPKYR